MVARADALRDTDAGNGSTEWSATPGCDVMLRGTPLRLRPVADTGQAAGDIRVEGALGGSRWTLVMPSGLLATALDGAVDLETLLGLDPEDVGLVVEHLLGGALGDAEAGLGGRIAVERVSHDAGGNVGGDRPGLELARHLYEVAVHDVAFVVEIFTPARSRLGRRLADTMAAMPRNGTAPGDADEGGTSDGERRAVALGPLFLDTGSLEAIEAGDLLAFDDGEALAGGLFAAEGVVPLTLEAGAAIVTPGFGRAAAGAARPGQAKLWVECGTARIAAARRLVAGSAFSWEPFGEDAAWLTLDGCRLRVAGGRLVDTGGKVGLRIERARVSAWA